MGILRDERASSRWNRKKKAGLGEVEEDVLREPVISHSSCCEGIRSVVLRKCEKRDVAVGIWLEERRAGRSSW